MPHIRDRRAAALAGLLAVLGLVSTATGLRVEATAPPPVAAAPPVTASAGHPPVVDTEAPVTPGSGKPPAEGAAPVTTDARQPGPWRGAADDPALDDTLPAPPPAPTARPTSGMKASEPARLEIPAIGLTTAITPVGLRADGTLQVPPVRAGAPAGWYRHSVTPGEAGASVIIGHVDTAREGPAVFFRLRELTVGEVLSVRRDDGTVARFEVYRVAVHPKNAFPSAEVYGPVDRAELRLITCGGTFDRGRRSYRDNVVVFAGPRS